MNSSIHLSPSDALLIVDLQNDFLPGGRLAVPGGDQIIPILNDYLALFSALKLPIFASRDWHPQNHCSFVNQGGKWPSHCVAETEGGAFPPALKLPADVRIISKATTFDREAYSAFEKTPLETELRILKINRLFIGGLATEFCVSSTVKDALKNGFEAYLLVDGIRALVPGDGVKEEREMIRVGAEALKLRDLTKTP